MRGSSLMRFTVLVNSATKSIQRLENRKMERFGLGSTHTRCLYLLLRAGKKGLTQTELCTLENTDKAQISRVVRELTEKGYAAAVPSEEGTAKYRRRYQLTVRGREVATEINQMIDEVVQFVREPISEEETEQFIRIMRVICDRLKMAVDGES